MKSQQNFRRVLILFCTFFLISGMNAFTLSAEPKLLETAKGWDCKACHGIEKVLPDGHESTERLTYKGCSTSDCHQGEKTLIGKLYLDHIHMLNAVNCLMCHGDTKTPTVTPMKKCLDCHGGTPEDLAVKTQELLVNPHDPPHGGGMGRDCNLCHHEHRKSENFCIKCHEFDFNVP
jgi:hypothetical protein